MATEPSRQYMYDQLQKIDDRQPMTVYCIHCPEWTATGTAKDTRKASEAHRTKTHPELKNGKTIARKKRMFSQAMTAEREAQIEEERRQRMRALGIG